MQRVTVRMDDEDVDRLKSMSDAGVYESISAGVRTELDDEVNTPLRSTIQRLGDSFAITGMILLGITWLMPLQFRIWAVMPFIAMVVCYGVDRVLKRIEPAATERLAFWRGDSA